MRQVLGRGRCARVCVPIVAAGVFLAAPGTAAAHSGAPTVALDFRLRLSAATRALPGVRAAIVDGDRGLRLVVGRDATLILRGDLGEPVVRFDRRGVWVNRNSPTAQGAKLTPPSTGRGVEWSLRSRGHTLRWHDHRLAPPSGLPLGVVGRWSIPILLDGRARAIAGTFVRMSRPRYWLWAVVALGLASAAGAASWRWPGHRPHLLVALGGLAAFGALAASASFATADEIGGAGQWVEVGAVGTLVAAAVASLRPRWRSLRIWVAAGLGTVCATLSLGSLGVFLHGYVISTLPAAAARVAVLLAVVAGAATVLLSVSVEVDHVAEQARKRNRAGAPGQRAALSRATRPARRRRRR